MNTKALKYIIYTGDFILAIAVLSFLFAFIIIPPPRDIDSIIKKSPQPLPKFDETSIEQAKGVNINIIAMSLGDRRPNSPASPSKINTQLNRYIAIRSITLSSINKYNTVTFQLLKQGKKLKSCWTGEEIKTSIGTFIVNEIFPDKVILVNKHTKEEYELFYQRSKISLPATPSSSKTITHRKSKPTSGHGPNYTHKDPGNTNNSPLAQSLSSTSQPDTKPMQTLVREWYQKKFQIDYDNKTKTYSISPEEREWLEANSDSLRQGIEVEFIAPTGGGNNSQGIKILSTNPILAAHGIRKGDIIRKINGTPVNSQQDVQNLLNDPTLRNATSAFVEIERHGRVFTQFYKLK